jgi:hypothetical protein
MRHRPTGVAGVGTGVGHERHRPTRADGKRTQRPGAHLRVQWTPTWSVRCSFVPSRSKAGHHRRRSLSRIPTWRLCLIRRSAAPLDLGADSLIDVSGRAQSRNPELSAPGLPGETLRAQMEGPRRIGDRRSALGSSCCGAAAARTEGRARITPTWKPRPAPIGMSVGGSSRLRS